MPTKPIQNLNSAEAFMDKKAEKGEKRYVDLFFGISVVLFLNFKKIFAATDTTAKKKKKMNID